ncbi:hypothetical protein MKQ68_20160 [Chitinophaga horti]|uniref:DUF5362 domain-containing protein n=1 Tax=Chitinophaga horti TaxID=2920382 RepID=A0ABY6IYZ5_9BACT|nr:hypothetical protein [Chitinophaga horti]UYQ92401.1 hypothetical protein MKQ68_20160 [Chitinophaga horti]
MINQDLFELRVDAESASYLGQAARWAKFLAVVGFVLSALMIVGAFFMRSVMMASYGAAMGGIDSSATRAFGGVMTGMYVGIGVIWFFPCYFLFLFAGKMQKALHSIDQNNFNQSVGNLKSCFKFVGVFTIVILCFYVLAIIAAIVGAVMTAGAM